MQREQYRSWLLAQKYEPKTVSSQLSNVDRIERVYGDLDRAYAEDQLEAVLNSLRYSTVDRQQNRPNPSKIEIAGDVYNGLASMRSATLLYRRYRDCGDGASSVAASNGGLRIGPEGEELGHRMGLERDMQARCGRRSPSSSPTSSSPTTGSSARSIPGSSIFPRGTPAAWRW